MKLTYTILLLFFAVMVKADIVVTHLSVEGRQDQPLGIDVQSPSFGWQLNATAGEKDVLQTGYHILVASSLDKLSKDEGDLWDSLTPIPAHKGEEDLGQSSLWIKYEGTKLKPNQRCYWKVQVTTNKGTTAWSKPSMWGVGLLNLSNWKGSWIGIPRAMPWDRLDEHSQLSARYYRCKFDLKKKKIREATLHICGLGLYEAYINGRKVGNDVMTPAPTDYRKSQIYNSYDVTTLLSDSPSSLTPNPSSIISVCVTNGRFFTMQQGKKYQKITNFGFPTLRANLIVTYEDGTSQTIATDEKQWRVTADGPLRSANEYDGTIYDANHELIQVSEGYDGSQKVLDWTSPDFDDSKWQLAERMQILQGEMRGNVMPAIQALDTIPVKNIITKDDGRIILDFGQNISGWVNLPHPSSLTLHPSPLTLQLGDTIRIRYAEKLDSLGNLYTANLRHSFSTDYLIEGGNPIQDNWNHFTTHGFRYAEVSILNKQGLSKTSPLGGWSASLVADRMCNIGSFSCADTTLNKIYKAAWWGILDNYKGMPTDCPQRDERQPWLGDRAIGALGESYLFDNQAFYAKWLDDIEEAQRSDGCIPDVAPAFWNYYSDNVTWPSGFIFIPEMLYDRFGNIEPIRKHYNAMRKWLMHLWNDKRRDDGLIYADKYGDWCCPPESPELIHSKDPMRVTDGTLLGSCYFYRLLQSMERFDSLLINSPLSALHSPLSMERQGLSRNVLLADKAEYESMRQQIREAINKKFLHVKEGTSPWPDHYLYPDSIYYANNSITANLLPLAFGIVPEKYAKEIERQIVRKHILIPNGTSELKGLEGHIQCGVIGIQWLMRELTKRGRADVAYMLATAKTYPGWGYMVEHGATTIWELWNGDTANPAMNSGNHVMLLGDLLVWLYENIGGIQAAEPAFHKIRLAPAFEIENLPYANVSYDTPYGTVCSSWKKTLQHISWDISVPCNTTAEVVLPGKTLNYGSGDYHIEYDIPLKNGIIADEFLYSLTPNPSSLTPNPSSLTPNPSSLTPPPSCHASTIVECTNGDLLAAFFGGSFEGCNDVKIYTARKKLLKREYDKKGRITKNIYAEGWEPLQIVAKGEKACYNPVLYQIPGGDLLLFYKIGRGVKDWTGYLMRSKDNGYTWSEMYGRPHPAEGTAQDSLLGAIKNKPIMVEGSSLTPQLSPLTPHLLPLTRIIAPSSKEDRQWRCYMEISDDGGETWRLVGPIKEAKNIRTIQPTILQHKDGSLQILCRTGKPKTEKGETPDQARIATSWSYDNGETWTEMQLLDVPNNNSGIDAVTLKEAGSYSLPHNGWEAVLVYNPFGMVEGPDKPVRNPVCLARSTDGIHWDNFLTLEDSPISQYSYPSIIQGSDGTLHVIYTWRRQCIKYQQVQLGR